MTDPLGELRPGTFSGQTPPRPAVTMADSGGSLSYDDLDRHSRTLAGCWHLRGLRPGDHVAIFMTNRTDYVVAVWAAQRSGLYYTPVNSHLQSGEARHIIADCGASWLIVDDRSARVARDALAGLDRPPQVVIAADGPLPADVPADWLRLADILADPSAGRLSPEVEGSSMLYSSGTTGRPKGIVFPLDLRAHGRIGSTLQSVNQFAVDADSVYLVPAPLYHSAPLTTLLLTTRAGGHLVVMPSFDAEQLLAAVERFRVTHVQVVPTMLVRLLRLPDQVRGRYDLSSLRYVIHAAAPCAIDVKNAVLDWLGPIVWEYYSGSELLGRTVIGPQEWLTHPGSVGRSVRGPIHVLDTAGVEVAPGRPGRVYFETYSPFRYHGDAEKTAAAHDVRGWSTMGDVGFVDEDGYLYLTGRTGDTIITGGVNVYPQEIEDVLLASPRVADVGIVGVPDAEYGQVVVALVQLESGVAGSADVAAELIAFARGRLAGFKCPRRVEFVTALPRTPSGKLQRHRLAAANRVDP